MTPLPEAAAPDQHDNLAGYLGNALQILKACQGKPNSDELADVRRLIAEADRAAVAWEESARYVDQTDQGEGPDLDDEPPEPEGPPYTDAVDDEDGMSEVQLWPEQDYDQ